MRIIILASLFYLLQVKTVLAVDSIEVQALLPGMAVLLLDGQHRTVRVGETTPEGVSLISADSDSARLEVDGLQQNYGLGSSVSLDFVQPEKVQEILYANDRGMYLSVGNINGQTVRFLVDTGATLVAMNEHQARSLGLSYRIDGKPGTVSTASGFANVYRVHLRSVGLGKIKRKNVEAVVIEGSHPGPVLLGMSFLSGLHVEKQGSILTLMQKK